MEMTEAKALSVLQISDAKPPFEEVLRQYQKLVFQWFPDRHNYSAESIEHLQELSQAFLTFCIPNPTTQRKLLSLDEMMAMLQKVCFGDSKVPDRLDDNDSDGSFDELGESCDGDELSEKNGTLEQSPESAKKKAEAAEKELLSEEEKDKKKSSKRKAQKKKRKEKKKQEMSALKAENNNEVKKEVKKENAVSPSKSHTGSSTEEEIDPDSAFVSVIAKKNKNLQKKEVEPKNVHDNETKGSATSRVLRGRQLALRGNELANGGHYHEAVQLFTEAVKLDPTDHRFYGNRSYCHERLGNFDRALSDAEKSIALDRSVPKGYFRKGKALSSLKKFTEAEECFQRVLQLDKNCDDAVKELLLVRLSQITDMGFTTEEAEHALNSYNSVEDALNYLCRASKAAAMCMRKDSDVFLSDDEDDSLAQYIKPSASQSADIKMDSSNPEGFNTIWVGNLQPAVTESMVMSLFSKYGDITSVKFTPEKFYAFINYKNKSSAGNAMRALQGLELCGKNLLIRFPHYKPGASSAPPAKVKISEAAKPKVFYTPINGDECYFWRTQGTCIHGNNCRYKHIASHKGIDKKKNAQK